MARRINKKNNKIEFLTEALEQNGIAVKEKEKTKPVHLLNLKPIKPLNYPQKLMIESFFEGNHIVADGSAGTGKTFLSLYLALTALLSKDFPQTRIIIVRSIVSTREIGFLPGSVEEKIEPYEIPYKDIVGELLQTPTAYDNLKEKHKLQFMPTSFIRGVTYDDSLIIIDEGSNLTLHEMDSVVTRLGRNSRLIVCSDWKQSDLIGKRGAEASGYQDFLKIISHMKNIDTIKFTSNDIVRSEFVKSWIVAKEELNL